MRPSGDPRNRLSTIALLWQCRIRLARAFELQRHMRPCPRCHVIIFAKGRLRRQHDHIMRGRRQHEMAARQPADSLTSWWRLLVRALQHCTNMQIRANRALKRRWKLRWCAHCMCMTGGMLCDGLHERLWIRAHGGGHVGENRAKFR